MIRTPQSSIGAERSGEERFNSEGATTLEVSLFRGFIEVARQRVRVSVCTAASLTVGLAVALLIPVQYTATTRILTPQQVPSSTAVLMNQLSSQGTASLAAAAGGGFGMKNPNDTYIGMLTSRTVEDSLIETFKLTDVYGEPNLMDARKELSAHTNVSSERSGFIAISVTERDKQRAADIANAYTEKLRELTKTLALTEASQRRLFYEGQIKAAKDELIEAELAFQKIQEHKGVVQLDAQAKALIANAASLRAAIAAKQVELQTLRSYSTERNPELQLVESQLTSMQAEAAQLDKHGRFAGSSDLGMQDLAGVGADYLRTEHNLQYRQIMFDLLLKQYDAARLDESKYPAVIQVVETALPPERKSSPHRFLIILSFTVLGFIGACVWTIAGSVVRRNPDLSQSFAELRAAFTSK